MRVVPMVLQHGSVLLFALFLMSLIVQAVML